MIFLKIRFFFHKILKIRNFLEKNVFFHLKKKWNSNAFSAINLRDMNTFKIFGICRIIWKIRWQTNFGARALARAADAKPHFTVKAPKSSNFGLERRIYYLRVRRCARQNFSCYRIFHKIFHFLDILNVFIFLNSKRPRL